MRHHFLRAIDSSNPLIFVGGKTASTSNSTTVVSLTDLAGGIGTQPSAGDLVLVAYAITGNAYYAGSVADSGGSFTYVEPISPQYADDTNDVTLVIARKILSTAETSLQLGPTGATGRGGAAAIHVWRNANQSTPLDVSSVGATGIDTGSANPGAITPVTPGAQIIVVGAASTGSGGSTFTASYLSNFFTLRRDATYSAVIGMGSVAWSSGSYDPAQFSGNTGTSNSWAAATLAIRPA